MALVTMTQGALAVIGRGVLSTAEETGALLLRAARAAQALARARIDGAETLRQTDRLLRDAAPLLALSSLVVGGIVGMQGLEYVRRYSATEVFGWAATLSAYRDVGPLLLGCALAARTGARNTSELAIMAARERLDALRALGVDPEQAVVLPRLLATIAVAALVWAPTCTVVLGVGFVFAAVVGDQRIAASVWSAFTYAGPEIVAAGLLRMLAFGLIVGLASCHAGVSLARGEARDAGAIGRAVYAGSVLALAGVVTTNAVLSVLGAAS